MPPPRLRPRFGFTPGLSRKGGPPLRAGPPFLDLQEKPGRAAQVWWRWPEAGWRQGRGSESGISKEEKDRKRSSQRTRGKSVVTGWCWIGASAMVREVGRRIVESVELMGVWTMQAGPRRRADHLLDRDGIVAVQPGPLEPRW